MSEAFSHEFQLSRGHIEFNVFDFRGRPHLLHIVPDSYLQLIVLRDEDIARQLKSDAERVGLDLTRGVRVGDVSKSVFN